MGTLNYTATVSLDGYVADANGDFDWSGPTEEVFDFHVARIQDVTTEILGRNTYTLMQYWQTYDEPDGTDAEHEFARRWRDITKVVASSTMTSEQLGASSDRLVSRLTLDDIRDVTASADGDVAIFGPTTAAPAIRAGLIDVFEFFTVPMIVGGGLRALPDDVRLALKLTDQRTFNNGLVYTRYERA